MALVVLVPGRQAVAAELAGALQLRAARRQVEAVLQFCQVAALVLMDLSVRAGALRVGAATLAQRIQAEQPVFLVGLVRPQCQLVATKTWWQPAQEFASPLCMGGAK